MPKDSTDKVASETESLMKLFTNFVDESLFDFFRVAQAKKISKNDYCYESSKFEKRFLIPPGGSKMLPREKYKKK